MTFPSHDVCDDGPMIITTIVDLEGRLTDDQTKLVKQEVYDIPPVGAVAFEVTEQGTQMFLKHPEGTEVDREAIAAALAQAGPFRLA